MRQYSASGLVDEDLELEHQVRPRGLDDDGLPRSVRTSAIQTSERPRMHIETRHSEAQQSHHHETEHLDTHFHGSHSHRGELAEVELPTERGRRRRDARLVVYNPAYTIDHMLYADKLLIRRSWRSLPGHWAILPLLSFLVVELSNVFPESVIENAVPIGSFDLLISFPLFILPLAALVAHAFWKIYNRHLILDSQYLIYYRGNFSAMREVAEMEVARMQVVTVKQSPWEALLGVGNVSLGTFTRRSLEFDLYGVANPHRLARIFKLAVRRARELEKDEATADEELAHLEQMAEHS